VSINLPFHSTMNFHPRLWLLVGIFLVITRCGVAAEDHDVAHAAEYIDHAKEAERDPDVPEMTQEEVDHHAGGSVTKGHDDERADHDDETHHDDHEDPENPAFHYEHRDEDDEKDENVLESLTEEHLENLFKKFDANSDGKVTLEEVSTFAQKMRRVTANFELEGVLKPKDADKDGKLSLVEFSGKDEDKKGEMEAEFKKLDHNHDNFVDADELANLFHHHTNEKVETKLTYAALKEKDQDNNGVLSLEEFYHHIGTGDQHEEDISKEDKEVFNKLDLDGSSTLTLKELRAWESGSFHAEQAVKMLFKHADVDMDNVLTSDEIHAARSEIARDPDSDTQMYLVQWAEGHGHHGEL